MIHLFHRWQLAFYRSMLVLMRYELAIARSTGRNPAWCAAWGQSISNMHGYVLHLEINHD